MSGKKSDLTLYDLFAARFVGMDEKRIRTLMSYDERVRNPDEYFKLETGDFRSWQAARRTFCNELELMGVDERTVPVCFAYYIELSLKKSHDHTRKLWQLLYVAGDRTEFLDTCMSLHCYEYVLKCFPRIDDVYLQRILMRCYERIGKNGAGNGYFWMAFESAQKLKQDPMIKTLTRLALDKGEPELAEAIAKTRGTPLDDAEKRHVMLARLREAERIGSITAPELEFVSKNSKPADAARLVRIMIEATEKRDNYPQIRVRDALHTAEQLKHRLRKRELERLWKVASKLKDPHHGSLKLDVLRQLKEFDARFERLYADIMRETLTYNTRSSKVEQMREVAKESGRELTSRDWFDRLMHNDFNKSETLELLAKSMAAEADPNRFIHPSEVETAFLQTH